MRCPAGARLGLAPRTRGGLHRPTAAAKRYTVLPSRSDAGGTVAGDRVRARPQVVTRTLGTRRRPTDPMFDSLTIAPPLTGAGIERAQADVPADAIRQAAEHGEDATPETCWSRLPEFRARHAEQCLHPRHEAELGVCFARAKEQRHLLEPREVTFGRRTAGAIGQGAIVGELDRPGNVAERSESVPPARPSRILLCIAAGSERARRLENEPALLRRQPGHPSALHS